MALHDVCIFTIDGSLDTLVLIYRYSHEYQLTIDYTHKVLILIITFKKRSCVTFTNQVTQVTQVT